MLQVSQRCSPQFSWKTLHILNYSLCRIPRLPEHVSDEEGALMEPLSVAIHACNRGNIKGGEVILICGAGPIGLMCLLTAKAFGVTNICITGEKILSNFVE